MALSVPAREDFIARLVADADSRDAIEDAFDLLLLSAQRSGEPARPFEDVIREIEAQ